MVLYTRTFIISSFIVRRFEFFTLSNYAREFPGRSFENEIFKFNTTRDDLRNQTALQQQRILKSNNNNPDRK